MAFPKIKLGSQVLKKSRFDLSHDMNTSADFGHVMPMSCIEMIPNSSIKFHGEHLVRLAPLALPTWGRMAMHVYHRFVPLQDIYEPFENLMSAKSYNNGGSSYVPTSVPVISQKALMYYLLASKSSYDNVFAYCSVYKSATGGSVHSLVGPSDTDWSSGQTALKSFFGVSNVQLYLSGLTDFEDSSSAIAGYDKYTGIDDGDFVFSTSNWTFVWKLTDKGRFYRSLLMGLGYQVTFDDLSDISLLPLFAYFKAYFELFAPQRYATWTDTNLYKLMKKIETENLVSFNATHFQQTAHLLTVFFDDLFGCFYTFNQDFVSAHIDSPVIAPDESISMNSFNSLDFSDTTIPSGSESSLEQADSFSANNIRLIQKLLNFRNIETNIGGRIKEYFRTMFGTDVLHNHESNHVGSYQVNCNISDVMNQAASDSAVLGDYAGKGIGYDKKSFNYDAKSFGYFITLFAIVPVSNYFQGLAPHLTHTGRFTFYNPQFDSLGYELSQKSVVACVAEQTQGSFKSDSSFGFIPRYMGYKIHNNVVTGDLSLPSMRNQLFGYTLDRFVTPDNKTAGAVRITDARGVDYRLPNTSVVSMPLPTASPSYRYLNKFKWLSNFDRMFYNSNLAQVQDDLNYHEDNFFINNVLHIELFAPMKPVSESFTTEGEDGKTIDVVKS